MHQLVPPALSAAAEGFNVIALPDISAAFTKLGAQNSKDMLLTHGIAPMTCTPMITGMLGDYTNPAADNFCGDGRREHHGPLSNRKPAVTADRYVAFAVGLGARALDARDAIVERHDRPLYGDRLSFERF
ncbi:MAG: hypothetical protein NVS4B5_10920 [Vulcanimicrobiaceae bacterium]